MSETEINQSDDNSKNLSASISEREKIKSENSDSLSVTIQEKLKELPPLSPNRCIYRIPKILRNVNEAAYTPILVSIGPYHHKDESLLPMEVHKLRYLDRFLGDPKNNANIDTLLQIVKDSESMIRERYADPTIELSSDKFNQMVLLDSTFIIMFFLMKPGVFSMDDEIYGSPFKKLGVSRDIMLAENQLPFFILDVLYRTAFRPDENNMPSFIDIACEILEADKTRIRINPETGETTCCHLLHLLQTRYMPSERGENQVNIDEEKITCPSITSLYEAGIKFKDAGDSSDSLIDIRFDKGILTIPKLILQDATECEFRNLIAFEQCHYKRGYWVSDYIFFMDCLIDTPSDVELLVRKKLIVNGLGSNKEVSDLFNSLGKNVLTHSDDYKFAGQTEKLRSYYNRQCNRYRAILKHKYFSHPWAVISVFYAAILLILTLIQVVTGVISVV